MNYTNPSVKLQTIKTESRIDPVLLAVFGLDFVTQLFKQQSVREKMLLHYSY